MQSFTPIGVVVAEISVIERIDTNTADLISDETHTTDTFVRNNKVLEQA